MLHWGYKNKPMPIVYEFLSNEGLNLTKKLSFSMDNSETQVTLCTKHNKSDNKYEINHGSQNVLGVLTWIGGY